MEKSEVKAAVRIRGMRNIKPKIRKTIELLRLNKPNHCVIISGNEKMMGMLQVVKDYVAYGNVSEEILYKLLKKRAEKGGKMLRELMKDKELEDAAKEIMNGESVSKWADPVFRLHPPRKGYRNTKKPHPRGELGKRDNMDSLLKRMM